MSDLLILPFGSNEYETLAQLGRDLGYRVKILVELSHALDWLKMRSFDAVIIDSKCGVTDQEKLATALWNTNPSANFIVCSPETQSPSEQNRARLYGAELVHGPSFAEQIRSMLETSKKLNRSHSNSFPVLVVEDLDSPRDIICVYLESLGFSDVSGVSSAKEAFRLLEENPTRFSCILTDIRMPGMDGSEMIRQLRADKRFAKLPIVVLTAYGTVDCLLDCLRNGASGFLVKPPKRADMIRELGRAMRIYESGRNARLANADEVEYVHELLEKRSMSNEEY